MDFLAFTTRQGVTSEPHGWAGMQGLQLLLWILMDLPPSPTIFPEPRAWELSCGEKLGEVMSVP